MMNKFITIDPGVEYAEPTRQCLVCERKENPNVNIVDTSKAWLCDTCRTALKKMVKTHDETVTVEKKELPNNSIYIVEDAFNETTRAEFVTELEAAACLEKLQNICKRCGCVTMTDLYDLCAVPTNSSMHTFGWTTLDGVHVHYSPGSFKYCIKLPKPILLR